MPNPKVVTVKIAVAIDPNGKWAASGFGTATSHSEDAFDYLNDSLDLGDVQYWITAEVPIPEVREIQATEVQRADEA